jgi:hypothetical protein
LPSAPLDELAVATYSNTELKLGATYRVGTTDALNASAKEGVDMLWTIFIVLLILWLLGVVSSYTLGGYIHLLLLIAVAVVLIRLIQGRAPV